MPDLTEADHHAIAEAANKARAYLRQHYPPQLAGWLMCAMLASTFADMLRTTNPGAQRALADATNDQLAGTRWRVVEQPN
jgi:hypothetical protein